MAAERDFRSAREQYKSARIRLLLIAESPPSSGGYFYFDRTTGKDHLFRETMKAVVLWPADETMPKDLDKRRMLKQFQDKGLFLIDTCPLPVDKLSSRERRFAVDREVPKLVDEVNRLLPEQILIVKNTIYASVRAGLEKAGLSEKILNKTPIPFPSHGNQRIYREKLKLAD